MSAVTEYKTFDPSDHIDFSCVHPASLKEKKTCYERTTTDEKIEYFLNKYQIYKFIHNCQEQGLGKPIGRPMLLDALSTESRLPFGMSTFKKMTPEILADIKEIAKLMPDTLNCPIGTLKVRSKVTPLAMACHNHQIPLEIVEFLLSHGANPNTPIKYKDNDVSILESLTLHLNPSNPIPNEGLAYYYYKTDVERAYEIMLLFQKYHFEGDLSEINEKLIEIKKKLNAYSSNSYK